MPANDANDPAQVALKESHDVACDTNLYDTTKAAHMLSLKDRKQTCYCCGHINPNAASDCEKCYTQL